MLLKKVKNCHLRLSLLFFFFTWHPVYSYVLKSTLGQIALHIIKCMWAFFSKKKFALRRVESLLPSDQLVANSDHASEEPELVSPLIGSHWDPNVTQRKTVLSPWGLGRPITGPLNLAVVGGRGGSQHLWSVESLSLLNEVIISFHSYNNNFRVSAAIIPVYGWESWVQRHCIFAQTQAATKSSLEFEADRGYTPKLLWYKMQIKNVCEHSWDFVFW